MIETTCGENVLMFLNLAHSLLDTLEEEEGVHLYLSIFCQTLQWKHTKKGGCMKLHHFSFCRDSGVLLRLLFVLFLHVSHVLLLCFVIVPGSSTCLWLASCVSSPDIPPFCFQFTVSVCLFHQYSCLCSLYFSGLFSVVFYLFCFLRLLFPFGYLPGFCCPDSAL